MIDPSHAHRPHNHWLQLIAVYKLLQALLFIAIGVGARRLVHTDIGDVLTALADHLRFNPEARIVHFILNKASLLNDPILRRIEFAAFSYAGLGLAEGIGLYLEKAWGEVLTLVITASFLPWEMVEIVRRLTLVRAGLLTINIVVFFYLLVLVEEKRHLRRLRKEAAEQAT